MTDQELKDLVAGLATAQVETSRELKELAQGADQRRRETEEMMRAQSEEADRRRRETEEMMRALSKETDRRRRETEEMMRALSKETDRRRRESDERMRALNKKADRRRREIDLQLEELGKQIGGLGEKFGSYTEGMAELGIRRLLKERFGAGAVTMGFELSRDGESMEIDSLGYSNTGRNEVYVVEIKSKLRQKGIDQLLKTLRRFPRFFPEHRGKKLYGILAVAEVPQALAGKALDQGLYLARLGSTVELAVPEGFEPRSFQ